MSHSESIERLASRFFAAIEQRDLKTLAALYAPDAVIWHNSDNREQPQAENVAMLAELLKGFSSFAYANVRRTFFDDGFVQQHDTRGRTLGGDEFSIHCCMVVTVSDGRVARIDEYMDSAQLPPSVLTRISSQA